MCCKVSTIEMRDKPAPVDLDNLWQKLGVALNNGEVIFNDNADDAPIRKAIVSPLPLVWCLGSSFMKSARGAGEDRSPRRKPWVAGSPPSPPSPLPPRGRGVPEAG